MIKRIQGEVYADELTILHKHFSEQDINIVAEPTTHEMIAKYYNRNIKFYKKFISNDGFMHIALDGDFTAQLKLIEERLRAIFKPGMRVLELGAGNGANANWLAQRNPEIDFFATDLMNYGLKEKAPNHTQILADYHQLDNVPDNTFDACYAIETLCYSNTKELMFEAVAKKLKPGAPFIIFDPYCKERSEMTEEDKYVKVIWDLGAAVRDYNSIGEFESLAGNSEFEITEVIDLSGPAQWFADLITRKARKFFTSPDLRIRFLRWFLPLSVQKNAITSLLSSSVYKHKLYFYYMHTLTKKA